MLQKDNQLVTKDNKILFKNPIKISVNMKESEQVASLQIWLTKILKVIFLKQYTLLFNLGYTRRK